MEAALLKDNFNDLTSPEGLKPLSTLPIKQQVMALLRHNDVSIKDAAKALEIDYNYACNLSSKVKKYSIQDSKMVSAAHRSFKSLLKGKPVGKHMKEVKDSTVLKATEMIFDRVEPKVNHVEVKAAVFTADLGSLDEFT